MCTTSLVAVCCKTKRKIKTFVNKKVLLRERKRHTARRVANARIQWWRRGRGTPSSHGGRGVYPISGLVGGYPIQSWWWGVPHPRSGGVPHPAMGGTQGTPQPDLGWVPPSQTWDGVPPQPDLGWGNPQARPGMGYPPYLDLGWGTPPT